MIKLRITARGKSGEDAKSDVQRLTRRLSLAANRLQFGARSLAACACIAIVLLAEDPGSIMRSPITFMTAFGFATVGLEAASFLWRASIRRMRACGNLLRKVGVQSPSILFSQLLWEMYQLRRGISRDGSLFANVLQPSDISWRTRHIAELASAMGRCQAISLNRTTKWRLCDIVDSPPLLSETASNQQNLLRLTADTLLRSSAIRLLGLIGDAEAISALTTAHRTRDLNEFGIRQ
jgi:hypothetical protein